MNTNFTNHTNLGRQMDILRKIRLMGRHLCRMPRTRGFGVQSPTAYSFLRQVVSESCFLQRLSSEAERASYPRHVSRRERFLYRLRHHYPQVEVLEADEWMDSSKRNEVLSSQGTDSVLVFLDVDRDEETVGAWKALLDDDRCVLTFDMVDCGVVFFDKTKYKQHFLVNY